MCIASEQFALHTTLLIEIILSGNSIHACSSPEMEFLKQIQFESYLL